MFTERELEILKENNISIENANWQIGQFKKRMKYVTLEAAATTQNCLIELDNIDEYIHIFDNARLKIAKFVPASGAASRMFISLFNYLEECDKTNQYHYPLDKFSEVKKFIENIRKFAFYNRLNHELLDEGGVDRLINSKNYYLIIKRLLGNEGLSYNELPKGLLNFHFYAGNVARTPVEEHLAEGAKYAQSENKKVYIHFTVSPEHIDRFKDHCKTIIQKYQDLYDVTYHIDFSIQKSSTDTIAVTKSNELFYDENGKIVLRPGGHGALIENLNDIDSDFIFIKNIDNVVPEKKLDLTIRFKKAIGGLLYQVQQETFSIIKKLHDKPDNESISDAQNFVKEKFWLSGNCVFESDSEKDIVQALLDRLDRPIRVCGMVKNEGEPGGGPFLTRDENGCISPQIVESSQINLSNAQQKEIFNSSTHFNPVDLVCAIRNYKGEKFDLLKFVDKDTCFISDKTINGKPIKALELPGLWNGAMAGWNTIFVDVSIRTFNPVKTVNDLLREAHR